MGKRQSFKDWWVSESAIVLLVFFFCFRIIKFYSTRVFSFLKGYGGKKKERAYNWHVN